MKPDVLLCSELRKFPSEEQGFSRLPLSTPKYWGDRAENQEMSGMK